MVRNIVKGHLLNKDKPHPISLTDQNTVLEQMCIWGSYKIDTASSKICISWMDTSFPCKTTLWEKEWYRRIVLLTDIFILFYWGISASLIDYCVAEAEHLSQGHRLLQKSAYTYKCSQIMIIYFQCFPFRPRHGSGFLLYMSLAASPSFGTFP